MNEIEKKIDREDKTAALPIPVFVLLVLQGVSGKVWKGSREV